jgi:hypothetical protein
MNKTKKLFAMFALCAAAFISHPSASIASEFLPTYDQCMSWCTQSNDFFTCDGYCSRYPSEME